MGKELTIAELALASGKNENVIRQHINRGHLSSRKNRRGRVVIGVKEAFKWATKRGIDLQIHEQEPAQVSYLMEDSVSRIARVRILGIRDGGIWKNVCTTIRHRQGSSSIGDSGWKCEEFGQNGLFCERELSWSQCKELLDGIQRKALSVEGRQIMYSTANQPILSYLVRGEIHNGVSELIPSPFSAHSARLQEFWTGDEEAQRLIELGALKLAERFKGSGIELSRFIDHIGNVLIFSASDEMHCRLTWPGAKVVRLQLRSARSGKAFHLLFLRIYRSGHLIESKGFRTENESVTISLPMAADGFEFSVFDDKTGELVDSDTALLIRETRLNMIVGGPKLEIRDANNQHVKTFQQTALTQDISIEVEAPELIDSRYRKRIRHTAEIEAARSKQVYRVEGNKEVECFKAFAEVIGTFPVSNGSYLYFADPYFLSWGSTTRRLFLDILEALHGRELRVLCCPPSGTQPQFWLSRTLGVKVTLCCVLSRNPLWGELTPAFHDRWLASADREYVVTHSMNGWNTDGVTFAHLGMPVYFPESEELWNTPANSSRYEVSFHSL